MYNSRFWLMLVQQETHQELTNVTSLYFAAPFAFNPLKLNSSNYYTLPYRPNLQLLNSDIRALWRSALSARVPECQKLQMVS